MLDADHCYEALRAKDARFDGVFFVGVSSTGIYCRPVCPVRTPGRDRCSFYPSPALAEAAGFRPCLRCRPELAPGSAPIDAVSRLARAAAARIDAGALTDGSLETLATELGVGGRQLRRTIERELGVTPGALAQTRRLLLAKQLLTDTRLRVVDVAFASGFASVRQFNRTFRQRYRMTPSSLRKDASGQPGLDSIVLRLGFRPPFAWQPMVDFLIARAAARVERRDGDRYLRTARVGDQLGWLSARPDTAHRNLIVEVSASLTSVLPELLTRVRRLFDTSANPAAIDEHLAGDPQLRQRVSARPGLRVPGTMDGFELALRAVLGQQISVAAASTICARFADRFGAPVSTPIEGLDRVAPRALDVAAATTAELSSLGLPESRARTALRLAEAVASGAICLEPTADTRLARERLLAIPGIGPWTVEYIAMRALADPDALPTSDLGLYRATGTNTPSTLERAAAPWRPWRAYACMHCWSSP